MSNDAQRDKTLIRRRRRERVLKTVAVLPSLCTLGNLVCGLGAIYMCTLSAQAGGADLLSSTRSPALNNFFPTLLSIAAYLLIGSMFFDGIDGRLARLTRKTSEFGAQLDSLSDVVSFGVAPALLVLRIAQPGTFAEIAALSLAERTFWRAEWVMAAIYACCAALRLARFNVENEEDESAHLGFRGLPSPGAAGAIVGLVLFHQGLLPELAHPQVLRFTSLLMPPFALVLGLLMVSRFRYYHVVNTILRGRRPFWQVVSITILILVGMFVQFHLTLAITTGVYALSGPLTAGYYKLLGRPQPQEPMLATAPDGDFLDDSDTFDEVPNSEEPSNDQDDEDGRKNIRIR